MMFDMRMVVDAVDVSADLGEAIFDFFIWDTVETGIGTYEDLRAGDYGGAAIGAAGLVCEVAKVCKVAGKSSSGYRGLIGSGRGFGASGAGEPRHTASSTQTILNKQLTIEEQMAEVGTVIAGRGGRGAFRDGSRVARRPNGDIHPVVTPWGWERR